MDDKDEKYTGDIKPGFFKLRDKVHAGEEAGVPSTMRAMGRPPGKKANYTKSFWDIDLKKGLIVDYIKNHTGEPMPLSVLSREAGYAAPLGASRAVSQLMEAGRIRRRRLGGKINTYDYVARGQEMGLPKGDPRNGEVKVIGAPKT